MPCDLSSRRQRSAIGTTVRVMIATASRNHHGLASARTSAVSWISILPDEIGDREARQRERREDADAALHASRSRIRPSASITSAMSSSEWAGDSGSDRISWPARSADRKRRVIRVALAVPAETVHGEEVNRRRDPLLHQLALKLVAGQAEPRGVDADDVEMQRMRVARVAGERLDPLEAGEAHVVESELPLPRGRVLGAACRAGRGRWPRGRPRDSPCSRAP
jgi:hypothetical protein